MYTASKHAVVGLVRQMAYELAPRVRVNGVAPGFMRTDIRGPESLGLGEQTPSSVPDLEQLASAAVPLAFLPRPEDYTGHYVQLASRANAAATTGLVVACDGGLDVRGLGRPPGPRLPIDPVLAFRLGAWLTGVRIWCAYVMWGSASYSALSSPWRAARSAARRCMVVRSGVLLVNDAAWRK